MSKHETSPEQMAYWEKEGPRIACFLLIIPGMTLMGCGVGMILCNLLPYSLFGFGAGLTLWGLITVFRKRG